MTRLCRMIFAVSAAMATAIAAAGDAAVAEADGNALTCGKARFVFMTDRMVRCEWSEGGAFEDRPTLTFVNRAGEPVAFSWERRGGIVARTGRMTLEWTGGAFCETNLFVNGVAALAEDSDNLLGTQRTLDGKTCMADVLPTMEKGLLSRRGVTVVDDTATPLFVPAAGRNRKVWVAERPKRTGAYRDLTIFAYGHDYKGCLGDYVRFAGRIPLPPRWAFGYWWSRYWLYTDQEVRDLADDILSAGCPMDVFVIDMEWHETWNIVDRPDPDDEFGQMWGWTGYTWNKRLFPDPKSTLDYLHGKGCKVALNLHPASGVQPVEDCYAAFAADYGWTGTNAVPFRADEERWAGCYFKDVLGPLERQGVDFWWLDWQQWKMSKEKPSLSNTFWLNHIFAEHSAAGGKRPFIYHRWGGLGSHRYQVGFSGDCKVSWGMLAAIPWFTATASNVGYGYWGHDIGGHHNPDNGDGLNGELFTRWLQSGVFTPIFKTHSTKDAAIERRIWKYPEHYSALRGAMRLRYRLAPYIYTAARQAYDTGVSMCRPLYYDSPEDEEAYRAMNEYMFGDDILAVTVTNAMAKGETASQVDFYLPQGRWYDVSSGRLLDGGRRVSLRYAIDENPWLVKAGAIIPMYPESVHNLANPGTDNLEILFAPGATHGEASVYEDSGDNADYETNCRFTKIARDGWRIEIGPRAGAYTLRFPLVAAPRSVRVCGKAAKWRWDARDFALVVETPRTDGSSATVVEIEPCDGADEIERALAGMKGAQREVNAVTEEFKAALRKVHWAVNLPVSWQEFWQTPAAIAARPDDAIALLAHRKAAFREFMEKDFPRFRDKLPPSLAERILNMEAKVFLKRNDLPSEGQARPTGELQEKAQALADLAVKEGMHSLMKENPE